ncbi:hypothetical protein CHRY9390_00061 [Chryseobacterium aquaeductus]|uniref:Uncharacterized protein n=1 Tax=Chryseobacterium aquaeductus TaxID=2675056 RepID=A0A9N8QQN3_9FLAO|nr:hypothetical protein [Chryseobacterium aquaeductus]CAA7329425.1 hypothetical protein CHRY9390_00061 [Chryseobacterium potabilaquae]CAD7796803.1 hypothetical protein CHRY9390_00061 [Chryseobacterium aquaeductus]
MEKNILKFLFLIIGINFFAQSGSIGIGTSAPHSSAILDLVSGNKGIMIPKISLNQNNVSDYSFMIAQPTESLLIYNTNASFPGGTGLYYWDGTKWVFYFNGANINLLLGITKYYSKIYNSGVSTNNYPADATSVSSFVNGSALASPWVEITDPAAFNFTIERPENNAVITFTGMLQLNNTSSSSASVTYGLGIFVDNQLISSKSASMNVDNTCAFQEFTITGLVDDLSVGTHNIRVAVMNRSSTTSTTMYYGRKAASCTNISNDEAKISVIALINQPLPY